MTTARPLLLLLSALVCTVSGARLWGGRPGRVVEQQQQDASSGEQSQLKQKRRWKRRMAFQMTEPIFELDIDQYKEGKPYLIQFKGKGDDYCAQMEPLKEQLEEELGVNIKTFEVWYDSKNLELLQRMDRGRCGGVPFFYNKRSRRYICGATTYANLRAWALCQPCEPIAPPPNLNEANPPPQNAVQRMFGKVKTMAQEKMKRGDADDDEDEDEDDDEEE